MEKFKFALKVAALLTVCLGIPTIAWALLRLVSTSGTTVSPPSYAELVAIVLTAVTVVLAALAIVIAILAVWGYQSIKSEAAGAAERAVKSTVEASVAKHASDHRVKFMIQKELSRILAANVADFSAYDEAFPSTSGDVQQGNVGTEYPGDDDGPTGS